MVGGKAYDLPSLRDSDVLLERRIVWGEQLLRLDFSTWLEASAVESLSPR